MAASPDDVAARFDGLGLPLPTEPTTAHMAASRRCEFECEAQLLGHRYEISGLVILPSGDILSGSHDGQLRQWDCKRGCVKVLNGPADSSIFAVEVLPDGRAVSGHADGSIKVWDLTRDSPVSTLTGHALQVNCLAVLPSGRVLSGSSDRTLKMWLLAESRCVQTLTGPESAVYSVAVLKGTVLRGQKGGSVVVSGSGSSGGSGAVHFWDVTDDGCVLQHFEQYLSGPIKAMAALPDGRLAFAGPDDEKIAVWHPQVDLAAPERATRAILICAYLYGHAEGSRIYGLAALPDGRLASGAMEGGHSCSLKVFDVDGSEVQTLMGDPGYITCVKVLPDGRIVSGINAWHKIRDREKYAIKIWADAQREAELFSTKLVARQKANQDIANVIVKFL